MTNTIYIHHPEQAFSFTRLPNFLFEAPTFQSLSNEAMERAKLESELHDMQRLLDRIPPEIRRELGQMQRPRREHDL